jgi:uncharacterized membrane protein
MKKLKISKPLWQVLGLGVLAGMRTTAAPAIASHILSHHRSKQLSKSPLNFMQNNIVAIVLKVFAAGELVGDKLPNTPNRIEPVGIICRCLSGALAGASIYKAIGNSAISGALLGSIAAFGSTYGSYFLRKDIVGRTEIFDPIIGAIEDVLVAGAGVTLVNLA